MPMVNSGSIPSNQSFLVLLRTDLRTHLHKSMARNAGIELSQVGIHGVEPDLPVHCQLVPSLITTIRSLVTSLHPVITASTSCSRPADAELPGLQRWSSHRSDSATLVLPGGAELASSPNRQWKSSCTEGASRSAVPRSPGRRWRRGTRRLRRGCALSRCRFR